MGELTALQPAAVFRHFEDICRIPHGSGNVSALVDHCVAFAKAHGLEWDRDQADNLVIRKSASPGYEKADILILQGHTDMVCEKEAGLAFDFTKDGIRPYADGEWLRARGTTLGADNGIAVAMCLALLEDDTLAHPPLEVLFTSDEETGMVGAFAFDCSRLKGHRLINLDSEYEGVLLCSCAGGATVRSTLPVARESLALRQITVDITGLRSGHSGVEIDKGRANANVLMGRLLSALAAAADFRLIRLSGGPRETAIACQAQAVLGVLPEEAEKLLAGVSQLSAVFRKEYASTEPDMAVTARISGEGTAQVLTAQSTRTVCRLLLALPDGVQVMSADMPGLVQTSLNFGTLALDGDRLTMAHTVRSSMTTQKQWIVDQVRAAVALAFLLLVVYPFLDRQYSYREDFHGWDAQEPDGTFKPGDPLTRQEFFQIIENFCNAAAFQPEADESYLTKFDDKTDVANWAREAAQICVKYGYVNGRGTDQGAQLHVPPGI